MVVREERRGYGSACLKAVGQVPAADILVFMDGDGSDDPREIELLLAALTVQGADLVIGSRVLGQTEEGALTPVQTFGNSLTCGLVHLLWGVRYTDLGPFRAVRWETLQALEMQDRNYGWTVEMQIKAAQRGVAYREVPVSYRQRVGVSKVSGTLRGSVGAGVKILWLLGRYAWS